MKLILFLLFTTVSCQQLQNANFTLPSCGFNTNLKKRRSRIAFISHDSAIATFFHNPEQGSRDAANIVDLDVEWNRYLTTTESRMAQDIKNAVDNGIDGIISSIPNDLVYEAIQYANSKRVPIIIFNSGLEYAKTLGLARVMQDDLEAGFVIGQRIKNGNFSRPLIVHLSNMENKTINSRINGIQKALLGKGLGVLNITETVTNSTFTPVQLISDTFKNGLYDSIISLGGSMCADFVSTAMLSIRQKYPDLSIASGFFDVGGNNMTELFNKEKNTFAVTQLPYYQTALPVFYMYLMLTTGHDIYFNRTIKTGPNLITNETLPMVLQNEQNSLMNINDKFGTIGAIVPNSRGDTYNAAMMAGVANLASKLNWTVVNPIREDPLDISKSFRQDLDYFMKKRRTSNIVIQTSDQTLLDYAANRSRKAPDIGVAVIGNFFEKFNKTYTEIPNIGLDMNELAQSVAQKVVEDGNMMPICFSERTSVYSSPFCRFFYREYSALVGSADHPSFNQVVQSIYISSPSAMENEFIDTLHALNHQGYVPDSFITFSEYIFTIINNRILKGYLSNNTAFYTGGELFDQNQAFLEGRVKGIWATNLFAVGFMTLLYSLLSRVMTSFPSWEGALISAPRIERVCEPGTYHINLTTDAYCQDAQGHTRMSIQCIECPENTYSANPNQAYCNACKYGTYSFAGSSACVSCYSPPKIVNNTICANYITEQEIARKQLFMAIFIPIGVVLLSFLIGLIIWYCRQRFSKQREIGSDENWLLSFEELVKPKTSESPGDREDAFLKEKQRDIIMGANSRLFLGESSVNPASGSMKRESTSVTAQEKKLSVIDDSNRFSNGDDTLTPSLHEANLIGTSDVEGGTHHKRSGSKTDGIKFQTENTGLIHALGFHRNLPVYVKQIGYKKVRVDEKVRKEVSLVKDARHPNLIEFVGLILEPQRTFIVEEYCTKGSLSDVLANPDINLAWIFRFSLINDLISGMRFLHRSKFMYHGCLTSNTCMITGRWELKISNYGFHHLKNTQIDTPNPPALVRKQTSPLNNLIDDVSSSHEQVAQILKSPKTLLWLAPESIVVSPLNVYITYPSKEADVYSVGIIINEILTRKKPYSAQLNNGLSYEEIFNQICSLGLRPHMRPSTQDDFTYGMNLIVSDCLQRNSHARPSFNAIASRVEEIDPYFCGSDSVIDNMAVLLEKYGNDMENLVKKRTFNLQQRTLELEEERARTETLLKDLKLAKEVAEAAAASKQSFLANMSHEIRTPMNAVIGMSRTLMESDLPPDLYECAETIESSGNHLMALIDDILDYSKIDSGKLTLERSMLDLTYVVESAIKLISSNYLSKGLVLWYNISPDLPVHVYGDIVRLRQILLNLLSNAFKFTQSGYVYVSVELYKPNSNTPTLRGEDEDEDYPIPYPATVSAAQSPTAKEHDINPLDIAQYLFSVKDSGIGIPKEKAKKLFKTFSQVDASTTRNFGGTGLGLAISKKLCKIMGGDMWVESDEGKGSTFFFKVNLQKQQNSNTYSEENNLEGLTKVCSNPLIIAERDIVRFEWNSLLKNFGITNISAMNLNEIQDNFKKKDISKDSYSIIIIDMDFEVPDENLKESTTSQSVLKDLKKEYSWIQQIPTLCIIDSRSKKTRKRVSEELEAKYSSSAIQHPQGFREPVPTPIDDIVNPFDNVTTNSRNSSILNPKSPPNSKDTNSVQTESKLHLVLKKPFKNSSLISILHELLSLEPRSLARNQRLGSISSINSRLAHNVSDRIRQASTEESERSMAFLASIKTLVVDDNPVNLKVLSRMLTQIGIKSQSANNGREAYETVLKASKTEEPFHLIFMDIWMPELNGFEATEKIRKEAASSEIQPYIIALTACVMTGDREKCMNAGMNGYVSKPIRKEELEAAIHTFTQTISNESSDL